MTLTHARPLTLMDTFSLSSWFINQWKNNFLLLPRRSESFSFVTEKTQAEPIMFANMFLLSLLTIIYGTKGDDAGGGGVAGRNALNFLPDLSQQQHSGMQTHKVAAYHVHRHRMMRCSGKSRFRDNFLWILFKKLCLRALINYCFLCFIRFKFHKNSDSPARDKNAV